MPSTSFYLPTLPAFEEALCLPEERRRRLPLASCSVTACLLQVLLTGPACLPFLPSLPYLPACIAYLQILPCLPPPFCWAGVEEVGGGGGRERLGGSGDRNRDR